MTYDKGETLTSRAGKESFFMSGFIVEKIKPGFL
jgi:hypothetical protein